MKYERNRCEEEIRNAILISISTAGVLRVLNLVPRGGNYSTVRRWIKKYDIDTSHFTGQGWNKGHKIGPKHDLDFYLKSKHVNSGRLREKLIKEGKRKRECERCKNIEWLGVPISLELDHIDGDRENNKLENLRILCPNCHALTPTYRGKNIKRAQKASV